MANHSLAMKRGSRALQFVSKHSSALVLLTLCLIYSIATFDEQHPTSVSAGASLGKRIASQKQLDGVVLIFGRDTVGDRKFADAIQAALPKDARVERVHGSPRDVALALKQFGEDNIEIAFVATHHAGSISGPLQPQLLKVTQSKYPALRKLEVLSPPSYYWPSFLTRSNLINVINRNADVAIIAIGMTMVIIAAGIDLSVGSVLAFSAVLTAYGIEHWAGGTSVGVVGLLGCGLIAALVGAIVGAFTGAASTYFSVPSFVVTLSVMMMARGGAFMLAGSPDGISVESLAFSRFANGSFLGAPNPIWIMLVLYALAHVMMTRTAFGRYIYAVGGNAEAARLSGVPVNGVRVSVFAICGGLAGLCGVISASRFETGLPAAGQLYELQVIAAVVVGGASLSGGSGRVLGTLSGAMILAVIENGLNMAHVGTYEKMVVFGGLILTAVLLDQLKKR